MFGVSDRATEQNAEDNIKKYVHEKLGQSTHISITDQKKFANELVLNKDYQYVVAANKKLLQDNEELEDEIKSEKMDHQHTKDQLNEMIKQFKVQMSETQKARDQVKQLEADLKRRDMEMKQLQHEKDQLQLTLDQVLDRDTVDRQKSRGEQSDEVLEEVKEAHQKEVQDFNNQIAKLQAAIKKQEQELNIINGKVHDAMKDIPTQNGDVDETDNKIPVLQCLDQIILYIGDSKAKHQKEEHKESTREKKRQLRKQIEELTVTMQEKEENWQKELEEAKRREKAMQRNINNYKQDVAKLKKKVEELNTPTPEARSRSSSLASVTALPQVDMLQRSFMVAQNSQPPPAMLHPTKKMKRQASSDTVTSLPVFKPSALTSSTKITTAMYSGGHVYGGTVKKTMQCTQCFQKINQADLIKDVCKHHTGGFNQVRQKWLCCNNPFTHAGCKAGRHQVK